MLMRTAIVGLTLLLSLSAQSIPSVEPVNTVEIASATPPATSSAAQPATPPPSVCPAGGPTGDIELRVRSSRGDQPLSLRTINRLSEGDTIMYAPRVRGSAKRHGEVSLVLVPAIQRPGKENLIVTDPKRADEPQQWKIGDTSSIAAFVYGPAGLSKKKVKGFLSQDNLLIAQLADYAEKTAQTEALIQALSSNETSTASVNAALSGFASQYGLGPGIDRAQPANQQALALFQTLNPALATYDPLQPTIGARYGQTASVATAVATLFFGSPVGLVAGGTAMALDLKNLAFPGTEFRSSFAVPLPNEGLNLCGQRTPAPPHTRVAYIWATRIPNTRAPSIHIVKTAYLPEGQKAAVPAEIPDPEWKYVDRARAWTLVNDKDQKIPISIVKLGNQKSLELDLTKFKFPPGEYHLTAYWDWEPFTATGTLHIKPLSDFKGSKLEAESQDKLIAKMGKVPVTLTGDDFEFTTKVEIKKIGDEFATSTSVPFKLPKGFREGPQDHMDVQINTADLDPGDYHLSITQPDEKSHPVSIKVLTSLTKIENLPIVANQGVATQDYVLKGENLGLIAKLESPGAELDLAPPASDQGHRKITVHFDSLPAAGASIEVKAYLKDRYQPLTFADAIRVTGPLPAISASTLSPPSGMAMSIKDGEFPAGSTLSAQLSVKNVQPSSTLRLNCSGDSAPRASLHLGEQSESASLQQLSSELLFLSFDTGSWPAGCAIEAVLDNGGGGHSEPFSLGRVIRLPQIENLKITSDQADNLNVGIITGRNLEMIEMAGWDANAGTGVLGLPTPIPGQGQKQTLRVKLTPAPAPNSVLYVWLRGEKTGRATTVQASP